MLSQELELTILNAVRDAKKRRHECVGLEHLLFALLYDEKTVEVLDFCGGNITELKQQLDRYLNDHFDTLPDDVDEDPIQTVAFQRVLHRVVLRANSEDGREASGGDLLIAMFKEPESHSVHFLKLQGIRRVDILQFFSLEHQKSANSRILHGKSPKHFTTNKPKSRSILANHAVSLNDLAQNNQLDELVGREKELQRTMQILCRRKKNNPVFVGEPGVGKTALVEGLACKIQMGNVPKVLQLAMEWLLVYVATEVHVTYTHHNYYRRLKTSLKHVIRTQPPDTSVIIMLYLNGSI